MFNDDELRKLKNYIDLFRSPIRWHYPSKSIFEIAEILFQNKIELGKSIDSTVSERFKNVTKWMDENSNGPWTVLFLDWETPDVCNIYLYAEEKEDLLKLMLGVI